MKVTIDDLQVEMTVQEYLEYKRATTLALPAPVSAPDPPKKRRRRTGLIAHLSSMTPTQRDAIRVNSGIVSPSFIEVMRVLITLASPLSTPEIEGFVDVNVMARKSVSPRVSTLLEAGWVRSLGRIGSFRYEPTELGVAKYNEYQQKHADGHDI